jgi:hypothetical protein
VDLTAVQDAVTAADAVVVCVGEETYTEKPGDIDTLDLPAGQSQVTPPPPPFVVSSSIYLFVDNGTFFF